MFYFFSNCEKEKVDYREKYIGKWFFKVNRIEFNTDSLGFHKNDSVEFVGQIELASNTNEIRIKYTQNDEITARIDEKGYFVFPPPFSSGNFEGTSKLSIFLKWGGQGGGGTHIINGVKQ